MFSMLLGVLRGDVFPLALVTSERKKKRKGRNQSHVEDTKKWGKRKDKE